MVDNPREWLVEVSSAPDVDWEAWSTEPEWFALALQSVRDWVAATESAAFGAFAFDDDFAYVCVGANSEVRAELLFDADKAARLGVELPDSARRTGSDGVATWAKEYAPMWTHARVVDALAESGGAADGVWQLMAVLGIQLPDP